MSTTIDQKAYLQKYLSGPSGKEKRKKKKKPPKGKGFKIIDDDIDLSKLRPLDGDELDILGEGEDAPQIAGIIDERPEEVRKLEQFKTSSKWRVINQDDGFNSKLQIEEIQKDVKEAEQENELIFGKMYSDSEDEQKEASDLSPPRKQTEKAITSKKPQNNSDSDFSPPRKNREPSPKQSKSKGYDSDHSPPRRKESHKSKEKIRKPSRWGDFEEEKRRLKEEERRHKSSDSPERTKKRTKSPKKSRRKSDSDSPPRKSQKERNDDSNQSPPRKSRKEAPRRNESPDSDLSPPRKHKQSPSRKNEKNYIKNKTEKSKSRRRSTDSDLSPPRKTQRHESPERKKSKKHSPERKRRNDSDSDLSPPRKHSKEYKRSSDSPPPTNKKMARTLEGKLAGLQNATQLRQENDAFRRREAEVFSKMTDDMSGRNAKAVSRKGKRDTSEDRQNQREKAERQKELDDKYKKWSKGLKQIEAQEARVQEFMHEASKPLARFKDDRDLEDKLKAVERAGDPMLQYIQERKRERGEIGPEKPAYKGSFPPNRFNIRPGYRWDGVDRSNGYEKKFFEQQSKRKAMEEEAYKWSTEDL